MARVRMRTDGAKAIKCPCGTVHILDSRWFFNGDVDRPTFSPSILAWHNGSEDMPPYRCHSYVTDGNVRFLDDCTHEHKGKTVPLPEWPRQDSQ